MDLGTMKQWLSRGGDAWGLSSNTGRRKLASTMTSEVKDCAGFGQCLWEEAYLSVILVSHFSALHFPSVMFRPCIKLCCYSLALGCLKPKVRICVKLFWGNRLLLSLVQLHQSSSIDWRNVESSRNSESNQQESEWWSKAEWSSPVWSPAKQRHRCGMTEWETTWDFPTYLFLSTRKGKEPCGWEGLGAHWYCCHLLNTQTASPRSLEVVKVAWLEQTWGHQQGKGRVRWTGRLGLTYIQYRYYV